MKRNAFFGVLLSLGLMFGLVGCKKKSEEIDWLALLRLYNAAATYEKSILHWGWYDKDGESCGVLAPGCNYFVTGLKVTLEQDPDYNTTTGIWFSYYSNVYDRMVKESPSGIIYDELTGQALNRDENAGDAGFDTITEAALSDKRRVRGTSQYLARRFSLSEQQATRVALQIDRFVRLKNRTTADVADFTQRLYGVNFDRVLTAVDEYQAGNTSAAEGVVQDAALYLNITPEATQQLMWELHGHLLEEQGIQQ